MDRHTYRGKTRDTHEWVYGSLIVGDNGQMEILARTVNTSPIFVQVDPKTVGQCLGLVDNKNRPVFEGDIMQGLFKSGEYGKSVRSKLLDFEIEYHACDSGMVIYTNMPKNYGAYRFCPRLSDCTIVGNIYDGPVENKKPSA